MHQYTSFLLDFHCNHVGCNGSPIGNCMWPIEWHYCQCPWKVTFAVWNLSTSHTSRNIAWIYWRSASRGPSAVAERLVFNDNIIAFTGRPIYRLPVTLRMLLMIRQMDSCGSTLRMSKLSLRRCVYWLFHQLWTGNYTTRASSIVSYAILWLPTCELWDGNVRRWLVVGYLTPVEAQSCHSVAANKLTEHSNCIYHNTVNMQSTLEFTFERRRASGVGDQLSGVRTGRNTQL